jgi:hypothetical protein
VLADELPELFETGPLEHEAARGIANAVEHRPSRRLSERLTGLDLRIERRAVALLGVG